MSKAYSIQKKLWKGYGKVAKTLASENYDIYRSSTLTTPISEEKWVDRKPAAFSKDESYGQTPSRSVSEWLCWVDGRLTGNFDIQQGDYLYEPVNEYTYFIATAAQHHTMVAIKCNATITVNRSGYSTTGGGFGPGDTEVASSVPCYIEELSSSGGTLGYVPAASHADDALPGYKVYIWDPASEIHIHDAIVDGGGRRFQVLAIGHTDMGSVLTCKAYTP